VLRIRLYLQERYFRMKILKCLFIFKIDSNHFLLVLKKKFETNKSKPPPPTT
jgi:hypothetical protein